jgi:hypothetical protein
MVFVVCTSHKTLEVALLLSKFGKNNPTTYFTHYLCVVVMDGMDD